MQIREDATRQGDKVERYKWFQSDTRGTYHLIDKKTLNVDGGEHGYQRNATNARVLKIAREWSWVACGVLLVAQRPDGTYWVLDGQHRKLAADKRSDIQTLPCLVFPIEDRALEAAGFLRANRERRLPRAVEQFNARLCVGEPGAVTAARMIEESGRIISGASSSGTFSCVSSLCRAVEEDAEAIQRIWPLLRDLCAGQSFHSNLLEGLFYLERRLEDGASLARNPLRPRVLSTGYKALLEATNEAAAYYAKGGAKVWARGLQRRLNSRARTSRISVFDDEVA